MVSDEISELLVRERLQRGGVERPTAVGERGRDPVFSDGGLPAPRGRRHHNVVALIKRVECRELEPVRLEGEARREL